LETFTKIFIHNIEFSVTREGILRTFNQYGHIKNINMPFNRMNKPRGLAFVIYNNHEDAKKSADCRYKGNSDWLEETQGRGL